MNKYKNPKLIEENSNHKESEQIVYIKRQLPTEKTLHYMWQQF